MKKIYSLILKTACLFLCFAFVQSMNAQSVALTYTSGIFDEEVSWQLIDLTDGQIDDCYSETQENAYSNVVGQQAGNTYQVKTWESFGDNWDGATLTVDPTGALLTFCTSEFQFQCNGQSPGYDIYTQSPAGNGAGACGGAPAAGGNIMYQWTALQPPCVMTCPPDMMVNTAPGVCESDFLTIPVPTFNPPGCGASIPTGASTVDGPVTPLNFNAIGMITTPFSIPGVAPVPPAVDCVTEVCFDVLMIADIGGTGFEQTNILGEGGVIIGQNETSAGDCNANGGLASLCVPLATYNAWAADNVINLTIVTDSDIDNICVTSTIQASVTTPTACVAFANDYNNSGDASDTYPLGCTTVVFQSTEAASGDPLFCEFEICVIDNEDPVLNCPGDITFNLQGGECEQIYSFDVSATDNCGLAPANVDPPVEYGGAFGGIESCPGQGATLSCGATQTSQVQEIDVSGFPTNFILTDGCFIWDNTAWGQTDGTINFYQAPAGLTAAAAPLPCILTDAPVATSGVFDLAGQGLTPGTAVCVPVQDVNGGDYVFDSSLGGLYMEIVTIGGAMSFNGTSCNGITADGTETYLCSTACGSGYYAQFGFNIGAFFAIQGSSFDVFAPIDPGGGTYNEFVSGDILPIGEHCFAYQVQDEAGNIASCDWCVTVNEYPEELQVTSLACNDLVNVSLDEGCQALMTADMFLEGGPYGCYDTDYMVFVEGFAGNVNLSSLPLQCGTTYTVTVEDVDTGVSCWGLMYAEDKIDPIVIPAEDITLNCLQSTDPGETITGSVNAASEEDPFSWGDFTTGVVGSTSFSTPPATTGAVITDVNVSVQLDHSWLGDVDIRLFAPDGTNVLLFDGSTLCNLQDNMDATFDSDAASGFACMGSFSPGIHENCIDPPGYTISTGISGTGAPVGDLSQFNGTSPGGDWTIEISDNVGGDGGCLRGVQLVIDWEVPAPGTATVENSCGTETLTYVDSYQDNDCDGATITRTWIATDECGNSGTANQTITLNQIGAAGENSEWFWPDNPVTLTCGAATSPDDVYAYFRAYYEATYPLLPSWAAWPDEYPDEIAEWECNANAYGVRRAYPYFLNAKGLPESFITNNCNMLFTYDDLVLPACGTGCNGNSKIIRTWTALDWCTAETRSAIQVLHAKDNEAPTFDLQATLTVSASPWGCAATFYLPVPEHMSDDCSAVVTYRVYGKPGTVAGEINAGPYYDAARGQWRVDGLPKAGGPHEYIYEASDCCGNLYTASLFVTVVDGSAPIAVAKQNVVISLTTSPTDPDGGLAKLYVHSVNNGSHDGDCGPVRVAIRRVDDESCGNWGDVIRASTGERHNNNSTFFNFFDLSDNQQPTDHDQDDTDEGEYVKFCCSDLTGPNAVDEDGDGVPDYAIIQVELGVWDDANMDGVPGTPGDLFGLTWADVRVEAKLQPQLICPPKAMITCDMDENDDFVIEHMLGRATANSTCGALNTVYEDVCGLDLNGDGEIQNWYVADKATFYVDEEAYMWDINGDGEINSYTAFEGMLVREDLFLKACHYGPIMRWWSIEGTNIRCLQIVIISEPSTIFDGFTQIDWPYSRNEFINLDSNDGDDDCNGDGTRNDVSSSDITLLPDGADVPTYSEVKMDCIDALCEEPAWVDATCSLIGWSLDSDTFYFEGDACRKIINTYTVIDWCQYELGGHTGNGSPGIWTWTVIGKLIDPYAPGVVAEDDMFPAVPGTGGSGTGIDESACVGVGITMSATATDRIVDVDGDTIDNACPSQWLKWNVLLDINNDWVYEREWSSFVAEDRNTSTDPLWSEDNLADNLAVYGYPIPDVRVGNTGGVDNAEDFATAPGFEYTINIPDQIPADCGETQHRVVWKAYDGCGNVTSVTSYFTVQDKKAPTPYCINLSTALMENGEVELWAIDFDAGSFDNCTEYENLRFTFTDVAPELDPYYISDVNSSSHIFVCDDMGGASPAFLTLPIYVWDECGNYDFCLVNLRLVDNQGGCVVDTTGSRIAGNIHTSFGEMIEDVEVMNETYIPELSQMDMTDATGHFLFGNNDNSFDYSLSGSKNDDYLNGVSTLDLVLIQRHILGLEDLNDPYKMIAADVNNDGEITAIDLIELRKLILGIYDELPNNGSWKFGDANQVLDTNNPWSFIESIDITNLSIDMMHEDFVGVKIGDVNESVEANQNSKSTEITSTNSISIEFNDRNIAAGELVELTIGGTTLSDVYGYQFTMATEGLELVNVESGLINISEENFGSFGNLVTTSWNSTTPITTSDALFTMTFKSAVSGRLSDIIKVNSEITKAEAYVGSDLQVVDINVDNNIVDADFTLYQNEPNPFTTNTVIGFVMPEAADATLTVYDVTGKVIKLIDGNYAKGYNKIELSKSDLGAAGVLYYQLDSGDFTATKKMIIIE